MRRTQHFLLLLGVPPQNSPDRSLAFCGWLAGAGAPGDSGQLFPYVSSDHGLNNGPQAEVGRPVAAPPGSEFVVTLSMLSNHTKQVLLLPGGSAPWSRPSRSRVGRAVRPEISSEKAPMYHVRTLYRYGGGVVPAAYQR